MNTELKRDLQGNLTIQKSGLTLLRWLLGAPLLLWGAFMLYGVISSFIITLQEQGGGGLLQALTGSLVLLLFTALILPLGWWIFFGRHWIRIDAGTRDIVQISDWRIGRKEKRTPVNAFRAVRMAMEPLNSSSTASNRGTVSYCQQIRLLAVDPDRQPSIEISALKENERSPAIELAQQVASELKLPLEVAAEGEILFSPAREAADREIMKVDEDE